MQDEITDFRGLIARWPSMGQFGREVAGAAAKGRIFNRRNRVPRQLFPAVIAAGKRQGFILTMEFLDRLYAAGRKQGR